MNESFLLKHHGNLSLAEQDRMSAEDRRWWIRRINEEIEKSNNKSTNMPAGKRDHTPGQPPI